MRVKIKIKNKLEGNEKNVDWRVKLKRKITLTKRKKKKIKLKKIIHHNFFIVELKTNKTYKKG
jgi:hypothetical protein